MIDIDAHRGEGGGQILRTSLALAVVTGTSFRMHHIRAGRSKPGLLRQHLTAVRAAAAISHAELEGDTLRSTELTFRPGPVRAGDYAFAVGNAGSAGLVLQTVLAPLCRADGVSTIEITGGTHNMWSPPAEYLQKAYLPLLERTGPTVDLVLQRHGFYPAGGGRYRATITPGAGAEPLVLHEHGEVRRLEVTAVTSNLSPQIAKRELKTVGAALGLDRDARHLRTVASDGPGNVVFAEIETSALTAVFTAFGTKGVSSERVGEDLAKQVSDYLEIGAPVGEHLADQLLLPLALGSGGSFVTGPPSGHLTTNIDTVRTFLDVPIKLHALDEDRWRVSVG